jgi:hypothetical protein
MARIPYFISPYKVSPKDSGFEYDNIRMLSLSQNLDSLRAYGWQVEFYGFYSDTILGRMPKISLAVKSFDLPEVTAKVTQMSMCGYSGQVITNHVDKTFKVVMQQLLVDNLLKFLKDKNLLMSLGDSRHSNVTKVTKPLSTRAVGTGGPQVITTEPRAQSTFGLKLCRYDTDGRFHHAYAFTDCRIVGFKQSNLSYNTTNEMSEIELSIVFDEMILCDETEFDKSPNELKKIVNT